MLKDRFRLHKEVHHGKRSRKKRLGTLFTDFSRCCSWQLYQPADKRVAGLSWLNFGKSFGLAKPLTLNLGVLVLTFGLTIKFTIGSIIGIIVAAIIYHFI